MLALVIDSPWSIPINNKQKGGLIPLNAGFKNHKQGGRENVSEPTFATKGYIG
jgi:hypothetical protein